MKMIRKALHMAFIIEDETFPAVIFVFKGLTGLGLDRRLIPLGLVDKPNYARKHRRGAGGRDPYEYDRHLIHAGAVDRVTGPLGHGKRLAREGGFVNVGACDAVPPIRRVLPPRGGRSVVGVTRRPDPVHGHQPPVGGDASAGEDEEKIPDSDLRNIPLLGGDGIQVDLGKERRRRRGGGDEVLPVRPPPVPSSSLSSSLTTSRGRTARVADTGCNFISVRSAPAVSPLA